MENQFSKIILGTVQLGMPYGRGRWADELMPESEAFKILDVAFERGITTLDTAQGYGLAEARIARYLTVNPDKHFHIITKFKNYRDGTSSVKGFFERWKKACPFMRLENCSSLSVLLHRETDITDKYICGALSEAVEFEQIKQWGVSVYTPKAASLASNILSCKIVQLPFGPINQSFSRLGIIEQLERHRKIVIARSVFAQGRLFELMRENSLDQGACERLIVELRCELSNLGIPLPEFALSLALSEKGVSNVLIGVDAASHLVDWLSGMTFESIKLFSPSLLKKLNIYDGNLGKPHLWG